MNFLKSYQTALFLCLASSVGFAQAESEGREWNDRTGDFSVRAKLLEIADGKVKLKRTDNGKVIEIAIEKLSIADRQYCRSVQDSIGMITEELKDADVETPKSQIDKLIRQGDTYVKEFVASCEEIYDSDKTTAQRTTEYAKVYSRFLEGLGKLAGRKLRFHAKIEDVTVLKKSRRDVLMSIRFRELDFGPSLSGNAITVVTDPKMVERLKVDDVIRLDGTFGEVSRKTIDTLDVTLSIPLDAKIAKEIEKLSLRRRDLFPKRAIAQGYEYYTALKFSIDRWRKLDPEDAKLFSKTD